MPYKSVEIQVGSETVESFDPIQFKSDLDQTINELKSAEKNAVFLKVPIEYSYVIPVARYVALHNVAVNLY